jgi:hypothetical protein
LFSGIAALIALAMVFAGCAQPTDMNITTEGAKTLVKLDNPVVHVTAYDGFNVVSWEPVRDADTYEVWRLDTSSSSQVRIGTTVSKTDPLKAVDNVTTAIAAEKLANGRAYKYIVLAIPDAARYAITAATAGNSIDAHNDIYSGKGEATVTAKVPDPATYRVPKATDIKTWVDPLTGTLYVSWTQPANATADIGYFPGGYPADAALDFDAFTSGAEFTTTALFNATGPGYLYPKNAVTAAFPVIGGKATIAIQTQYFAGTMYAADRPAKLDITLDQYNLDLNWTDVPGSSPGAPALTATHIYKTATTGTVQLAWSRILGDEDVYSSKTYSNSDTTKVTYNVYKRAITLNQDGIGDDSSATPAADGQVTGDWTKVNFTFLDFGDGHTTDMIYATETGDVASFLGSYEYIVYASASRSGKTSHSYPLKATLERTLPHKATITSAQVVYGKNIASDGFPYTNEISVTGLSDGVSYKLYRGELTPILIERIGTANNTWVAPDALHYQFTAYESTTVAEWTGTQVTGDTDAVFYDAGIEARKSYAYKLVSVIPGATSAADILLGDGSIATVTPTSTGDPASMYSALSLSVTALQPDDSAVSPYEQTNDTLRGGITATLTSTGNYTKGMDVKLFYRRADSATTFPGANVTGWTLADSFVKKTMTGGATSQITDEGGDFMPLDFQIPNPVYGELYLFKAVAYLDTKEMPNLDTSTYSGAVIDIAGDDSVVSAASISTWGGSAIALTNSSPQTVGMVGISGQFLQNAPVNVRIRRSTVRDAAPNDLRTYYEQAGEFSFTRTTGTNTYQVDLILDLKPEATEFTNGAGNKVADTYIVEYKFPWEKWESLPGGRTIRTITY